MKRGTGLQRKTPLRADPEATAAFVQRGREKGLRRATAPSDFRDDEGGLLGHPRHHDQVAEDRRLARARRQAARKAADRRTPRIEWDVKTRASACAICGSKMAVTGHHVIPLRMLKATGVPRGLWYDPRNHLPLCMEPSPRRCHQRHENYVARVPRAVVMAKAPGAVDFADEVGLLHVFDREYPA